MPIVASRLWWQPLVVWNILRNATKQELDPLLFNEKVFLHTDHGVTTSYCVLREVAGYRQLMDVFTYPEYRGKGYASALIREVVLKSDLPVYLICRRKVVSFYEKLGFAEDTNPPTTLSCRLGMLNTFSWWLFNRCHTVMSNRDRSI